MAAVTLVGSLAIHSEFAMERLNFGAFVGFILVNLSVIRHYYFRRKLRAGLAIFTNPIFPLFGTVTCVYLWINLS